MEIPLAGLLDNDPRLFQQVIVNVAANRITFEIEMNVHVFAESR